MSHGCLYYTYWVIIQNYYMYFGCFSFKYWEHCESASAFFLWNILNDCVWACECGYVWVRGVSLFVDMHFCEHVCLSVSLFSSTSRCFRLIFYIFFSTNHHFCKEPSCILLENIKCLLNCFSHVQLFVTTGFFRQQYWSELPCPCPGDLPDQTGSSLSPKLADGFFITSIIWEAPGE